MKSDTCNWCVLVPTCDRYSDLWPIFYHFLFKRWPDVVQPIYMITNRKTYVDPRVTCICTGPDLSWAKNVTEGLKDVPAEYVVLLLDDFFLDQDVPTDFIDRCIDQLKSKNGHFINLNQTDQSGRQIDGTWFRQVNPQNAFGSIQAAVWRKDWLLKICEQGLDIWQTESYIRRCVEKSEEGFFYLSETSPFHFTYMEAVRGRFWKPSALEFLNKYGVQPNLRVRPCPCQGRDFFSKLIRSFQKRIMQINHKLDESFSKDLNVYPL